jgi:hypothetical protein
MRWNFGYVNKDNLNTVKPVYNGHPRDPKKAAVARRWPLFIGSSYKTSIELEVWGLGWPLLTGGRYWEVVFNTGLTVQSNLWTTTALFGTWKSYKLAKVSEKS